MLPRIVVFSLLISFIHSRNLDDNKLLFWRRAYTAECEPFTTHQEGCNRCVCAADGVTYCTKMKCVNKTNPDPRYLRSSEYDNQEE
ncbi:uncharacterized protein ACR2FA_012905 [Aphomia sociella]